ncbi:CBFD-NFYB-HMF domain-containing protein [Mycena kentingensis (nom. inval.)]|nr:CBFD-NFYB-HMF domain-containing protein [Mycena kentingensis (nom. inval.)]
MSDPRQRLPPLHTHGHSQAQGRAHAHPAHQHPHPSLTHPLAHPHHHPIPSSPTHSRGPAPYPQHQHAHPHAHHPHAQAHAHAHSHPHAHPRTIPLDAPSPPHPPPAHPHPSTSGSGAIALHPHHPQPGAVPPTESDISEYREQDRFLPIANVSRLMKAAVPANTKIGKDAKECVQECVSEFISFLTSEAAERSLVEKRKTIGGEDILHAMTALGFDNYAEVLRIYLAKLRERMADGMGLQHQSATATARAEQYAQLARQAEAEADL